MQERITTTKYTAPDPRQTETFTFAIVLNTVQSVFASLTGYAYLYFSSSSASTGHKGPAMAVFPSRKMAGPLLLIAATSSLASPFGYAALRHVNYITFILAKSCKLLPVMALHVSLFGRRYPLHKYAVVAAVTAGVALFAMSSATAGAKKHRKGGSAGAREANVYWGLLLLGINLLFDGLTNSTQDYIFAAFRPYSGPQMMCAQNLLCTLLTAAYLLLAPYLPFLARSAASAASAPAHGELAQAWAFVRRHPAVGSDVLAFSACGAVGQIFICQCILSHLCYL